MSENNKLSFASLNLKDDPTPPKFKAFNTKSHNNLHILLQLSSPESYHSILTSYKIGETWETCFEEHKKYIFHTYNRLTKQNKVTGHFIGFIIDENKKKQELSPYFILESVMFKHIYLEYVESNSYNNDTSFV